MQLTYFHQSVLNVSCEQVDLAKAGNQSTALSDTAVSQSVVIQRVHRDFVGLEQAEKSAKAAMMDFSFYLTLGDMDEAFKAIKVIKRSPTDLRCSLETINSTFGFLINRPTIGLLIQVKLGSHSLIKHYTPVARRTLQTSYSFTQLQSLHVHLPLSCFSFHVITYHLVHGLSASLPLKFGIPYLFTLGNHSHSLRSNAI